MAYYDCNTLTEVMQMVMEHDNPVLPLKAVASNLNKSYNTLVAELNPYNEQAKFGADLLVPIMKMTGDIRPLEWIADQLGCKVQKCQPEPDKESWQEEHADDTVGMGKMVSLMASGASPEDVKVALVQLVSELEETLERYTRQYRAKKGA